MSAAVTDIPALVSSPLLATANKNENDLTVSS
jgi:hypothetical protein